MNDREFFQLTKDVGEAALHDDADGTRSRYLIGTRGADLSFAKYLSINRMRAALLGQQEELRKHPDRM